MKNQFKSIFICLLTLLLVGCGTINTIVRGDSAARSSLNRVKSPCETIPRIYSGIFYDICALRGKPSQAALWLGPGPELMLVDLALSAAVDTVFLPYTIYEQITVGSIDLK